MATRGRAVPTDPESRSTFELAAAKLESSGITVAQAEQLGIEWLTPAKTKALGTWALPLPALLLPYFGPDGKPLTGWPSHPPFYRLRYLGVMIDSSGFTAQAKKQKPVRYVQPPATSVAAYLPQVPDVDWLEVMADPALPLIITEGELKAACATLLGFTTIGLGGVQSWRSIGKGVEFLPELEAITWPMRHVYLCFDSDYKSNPMVLLALQDLAEQLVRRGAYAYLVTIPQVDETKMGLDDYLVLEGAAAFEGLLKLAEPIGLTKPLFDLNDRYLYVRYPGLLYDKHMGERLTPAAFRDHAESTKLYQERSLGKDGSINRRTVSAAAAWLGWPLRSEVERLTYRPGTQGLCTSESGAQEYSLWPGWGSKPTHIRAKDSDVKPFLALLKHLFTGAAPGAMEWFLRWAAHPLQYPGTKLFSSVLFWGRRHGTGKSLIGYTLGAIYGKNFTEITEGDIHANFNEWAENKQLVMGDDVTGSDKRQDNDLLKKLITQKTVRVNIKFLPTYVVPDCINYFFTANHPDAFFLEDDDRRSFVHEVEVGPLSEEFYVGYDLWLASGGPSYLHRWLLQLDLDDFNPAAPAFRTAAKERMIADVRSDLGSWVRELLVAPDALLKVGDLPIDKDLFSNRELLRLYDPDGRTRTTANGLGRELKRAGARQVLDGVGVKLPEGGVDRLYAVRNPEKWLSADTKAISHHLETWLKRQHGGVTTKKY